ncbi:hypothetical protein WJX81_007436 [Elliptochloris bilobata]|uniref:Glycosyltransferase 2-like domain-containing protein n=1 Tax=Elliptochloris bilobata TaxID=381761 RepID=A0AAW1SDP6_9CHLO
MLSQRIQPEHREPRLQRLARRVRVLWFQYEISCAAYCFDWAPSCTTTWRRCPDTDTQAAYLTAACGLCRVVPAGKCGSSGPSGKPLLWRASRQAAPPALALTCCVGEASPALSARPAQMQPMDFEGMFAYKLIIPAFTWGSILSTFLGPFFFPAAWFSFVAVFMVTFVLVSLSQLLRMVSIIGRIRRTVARAVPVTPAYAEEVAAKQRSWLCWWRGGAAPKVGALEAAAGGAVAAEVEAVAVDLGQAFLHAFIIPNYKEPMSVLKGTLTGLAEHPGARERYLVVLAMEAGENGHADKALKLIAEFSGRFRHMMWASHPRLEGEMPGKASNVDWAARSACSHFREVGIDVARVLVTNMDADAQVPALYVAEVDRAAAAAADPHLLVYAAPIVFERNAYEVPVFTRVHDFMWSAMAMQNLGSPMGLGFPISNYTMSAALLERIDFWDTVEDAIGEDFHMFVKAYFKTGGQARLAAIPAPINMLNLQAPSFVRTMWARMVQAERHARGCADFAYALKHARAMPAFSWTTVALCLKVLEAQMLPATAPFYMGIAAGWAVLVGAYVHHTAASLLALRFITMFGVAGLPVFVGLATCNERCRRFVRPRLFNVPNVPMWRSVDYVTLAVDVWLFMVLPTVYALTKSVLPISQGEYVVAEKGAVDAEGIRSPRALLTLPTHDSSSSLAWAAAGETPAQVGAVAIEVAAEHAGGQAPNGWREAPRSSLDERACQPLSQVLNSGSEGAAPGAKWAAPAGSGSGSGLGSLGPGAGGVPIRCRPSVSRHAAAAAVSTAAEAAQNTPPARGGDTTPRKQERPQPPELLRFLAGWGLPTLSTFRCRVTISQEPTLL